MVRPLTEAETAHNQCAWKRETGNAVSAVAKRQALDTWTSRLPVHACFLATKVQRHGK